jgi:tRNA wybutosine-synthesizing protein 1
MASKKGKPKIEKPEEVKSILPEELQKLLIKQHYHLVGRHSAVKACEYLRRSLMNQCVCYKQKFYGIESHRCLQMTPAVSWCTEKCVFCWRPVEWTLNAVPEDWDDPDYIVEESIKGHRLLISGYGGLKDRIDPKKWEEAQNPNQAAISLSGEPTFYPQIGELIESFHKHGFKSTYLVTNGTFPERLKEMSSEPTQLYLSLEAPTEQLFKQLNRPVIPDAWGRMNETLDILPLFKCPTVMRMTMVRGWNDHPRLIEKFAELIKKAEPNFIEVKSYMCVGYSRKRLTLENMLSHQEIIDYAKKIGEAAGYDLKDSVELSRVALLKKI